MIREREQNKQTVEFTFIGFGERQDQPRRAQTPHGRNHGQFLRPNTSRPPMDAEGHVVDGDPKAVRAVNDVWTFTRDVRASDPNWTIVATHGEDA